MSQAVDDLWAVAAGEPQVDANALAEAVETAAGDAQSLDYRTRLLIRDSLRALQSHWGEHRFRNWLAASPHGAAIEESCHPSHFDDDPKQTGFQSLSRRVVDSTKPETIERFFRELAARVRKPTRLIVGGSTPLILAGHLVRKTDDVDVVDEVPEELRVQYQFLSELDELHNLHLAHFQSHYLPTGFERRLRSLGRFGQLEIFLIDTYDIFVGKLFSARIKDRQDLNVLVSRLDRQTIVDRVRSSSSKFRSEDRLLDAAKHNWYVLFGEELPAPS